MFVRQKPVLSKRGVHIDLKGLPPTMERLERLVELFSAMKLNTVVVEWEDMFPWRFDRRLRGQGHYSAQAVSRFHEKCADMGLEVIPLVQTLGHMENLLQINDYAHLRELPDQTDCLHPLAPESFEIVRSLVEEVIDRSPGIKHFHLGGDEAWHLGGHPASQRFVKAHGMSALYMYHMEPLLAWINSRGIRPILWHDMMVKWGDEDLTRIGQLADLMVWGYRGTPKQNLHHHRSEVLDRFHRDGIPIWGAASYKGSDGTQADLPDTHARIENSIGWAEASGEYDLKGVIATGWSRYWNPHIQVEPIDGALPVLVQVAAVLHDGELPADSHDQAVVMLRGLDEWGVIEPLREALNGLQQACGRAWSFLRQIEEFLAGLTVDPTRVEGGSGQKLFKVTREALEKATSYAKQIPALLDGLVMEPWASRYPEPRIQAIRNALKTLEMRYDRFTANSAKAPRIEVKAPQSGAPKRTGITT